jgi:hypothetical protein
MSEHKHRLTHTPSPLPNTNTSEALPYCTLHTHSLTLSLSLTHKHSPSSSHAHTGTTAAGLRAGKPTWICPFFGDQFFWGEMIKKGGLGPSPCAIRQLTLHIVAESLIALKDEKVLSFTYCLYNLLSSEYYSCRNYFKRHLSQNVIISS